jgi:hypothetical protein
MDPFENIAKIPNDFNCYQDELRTLLNFLIVCLVNYYKNKLRCNIKRYYYYKYFDPEKYSNKGVLNKEINDELLNHRKVIRKYIKKKLEISTAISIESTLKCLNMKNINLDITKKREYKDSVDEIQDVAWEKLDFFHYSFKRLIPQKTDSYTIAELKILIEKNTDLKIHLLNASNFFNVFMYDHAFNTKINNCIPITDMDYYKVDNMLFSKEKMLYNYYTIKLKNKNVQKYYDRYYAYDDSDDESNENECNHLIEKICSIEWRNIRFLHFKHDPPQLIK